MLKEQVFYFYKVKNNLQFYTKSKNYITFGLEINFFNLISFDFDFLKMKGKPGNLFGNKLAACLQKLRDNSTIQVGHEQFKQLLINTSLADILTPFTTKMDTVDRLTERQKRQHAKLYMQLIDHFGQQMLLQNFYQRFMESLAKKTVCVAEVVGYFCKGYISRIRPIQNTKNYITYMLNLFRNHVEIHKIIKQMAQNISPLVVSSFQNDMISLIIQKMTLPRQKAQYIQCIMAVVLALEDKFQCQNILQPILSKNLKNQDWTVRKACVDICYTFMVVKEQINSVLHELIKQIKYDKIKNVRDSVSNYEALYKQVYGQEQSPKPQVYSQKTMRSNQRDTKSPVGRKPQMKIRQQNEKSNTKNPGKLRNQTFFKNAKDSDVIKVSDNFQHNVSILSNRPPPYRQDGEYKLSNDKVLKHNRPPHLSSSPSIKRGSQTNLSQMNTDKAQMNTDKVQRNSNPISPKFNLNLQGLRSSQQRQIEGNRHIQSYGKYAKKQPSTLLPYEKEQDNKLDSSLLSQQQERRQYMPIKKSQFQYYNQESPQPIVTQKIQAKKSSRPLLAEQKTYFRPKSDSYSPSKPLLRQHSQKKQIVRQNVSTQKQQKHYSHSDFVQGGQSDAMIKGSQLKQFRQMFRKFQEDVIRKLDRLDARVQQLQNQKTKITFGRQTPTAAQNKKRILQNLQDSAISLKNDHYIPYDDVNFFRKINSKNQQPQQNSWLLHSDNQAQVLQSNLAQKVNQALKSQNYDQAFSLVLANNKIPLLIKLLELLHIPHDKTVQQCLLLEIKKQLNRKEVLRWLKNYLIQKVKVLKSSTNTSVGKLLQKIYNQLQRQPKSKQRDIQLLKNMVINQMQEIFQVKHKNN